MTAVLSVACRVVNPTTRQVEGELEHGEPLGRSPRASTVSSGQRKNTARNTPGTTPNHHADGVSDHAASSRSSRLLLRRTGALEDGQRNVT